MYGVTRLDVIEEVTLINFRNIPADTALFADIFTNFSEHDIVIDMISQTSSVGKSVSLSFTCDEGDMVKVLEISNRLSWKHEPLKPMVLSGNAKIRLFGEDMPTSSGVFARAMQALSDSAIEIHQVTTSDVDISLLVSASHLPQAVDTLQKAFAL